jgi:ABC-type lipoprotein export system ATPase subunit
MGPLTKSCDAPFRASVSGCSMPPDGAVPGSRFPVGYKMIKSAEFNNFRSFNHAKLENCTRINVVVGDNGSGKTAFLEGIFLAVGPSPEIALRTRVWRGYDQERYQGTVEELEQALWGDLFHNFVFDRPANVSLIGTHAHNRSLKITFRSQKDLFVAPNRKARRAGAQANQISQPIEFRWQVPLRNDVVVYPNFQGGQLYLPGVPDIAVQTTFFAANRTYPAMETAQRFSSLSKTFQEEKFYDVLKEHFPQIIDVSIEVSAGLSMLFASIKNIPEKIPISLASGGMNKLAAILLAPAVQPGGIVLIDELESGFYYKRLPMIWSALRKMAEECNSQIFVSTHSAECLEAAKGVAEKFPQDFMVIRTVLEKGETKLRQFSGEKFVHAIDEQIDIR